MFHTASVLFSNLFTVWAPFLVPLLIASVAVGIYRVLFVSSR